MLKNAVDDAQAIEQNQQNELFSELIGGNEYAQSVGSEAINENDRLAAKRKEYLAGRESKGKSAASRAMSRVSGTASSRRKTRRDRERKEAQEGSVGAQAVQAAGAKDPKQAKYELMLRTQGPKIAQKWAATNNFTPSGGGGGGGGRGITQAFKNNPNMMGTPQAMQQFQQWQQYNEFLKYQQQQRNRGGVRFRAAGGGAGGGDVIPAMLTPGEFVMSAGAVRQHGVGAMRSLNRGQIPGFNRGGMVGGVAYRHDGGEAGAGGGGIGINTAELTKTFDGFIGRFSENLDKVTKTVSEATSALTDLAKTFGYFTMDHTVFVHGQIDLPGFDAKGFATQLRDGISGMVIEEVKKVMDDKNKEARS